MTDIKTLDLTGYTVEDLRALAENVKTTLASKRTGALDEARKAKADRAVKFNRTTIAKGDVINFLFNKKLTEGFEVTNVNEKSVSVKINDKTKYIKYENIVEIVKSVTDTNTDTVTDEEAVA